MKRQQRADERAVALRLATSAIGRLKQVWHNAPALDAALAAAEAAAKDKALPTDWVGSNECQGKLFAARAQLQQLQGWEEKEREMLRQQAQPPAVAVVMASRDGDTDTSGVPTSEAPAEKAGAPVTSPAEAALKGSVGVHQRVAEIVANSALDDDAILSSLQLQPRAKRPGFAERLQQARPPRPAPPLKDSPLWAAMVCGRGSGWPACRHRKCPFIGPLWCAWRPLRRRGVCGTRQLDASHTSTQRAPPFTATQSSLR